MAQAQASLAERLERGEILVFDPARFRLPPTDELTCPRNLRAVGRVHKDISYAPSRNLATGFHYESETQAQRLCDCLAHFAQHATAWLASQLPRYSESWEPQRV